MKLGRIIAAAATSGLLLSGAFVVAEEYTGHNVFAVSLDNGGKVEIKAKKGTVREVLIANNIPFGADDRVEPGLDTKVNGGETINIYKAHEITIVDGGTTTVSSFSYCSRITINNCNFVSFVDINNFSTIYFCI